MSIDMTGNNMEDPANRLLRFTAILFMPQFKCPDNDIIANIRGR